MSITPALYAFRPGESHRYPLPLTPEELREEIASSGDGRSARHAIRFTAYLDAYDALDRESEPPAPEVGLHADLAFFRLLHTANAVFLEWGERLIHVAPGPVVIRELAFTPWLAPLRAEVSVTLVVRTDSKESQRYQERLTAWSRSVGELSKDELVPRGGGGGGGGGSAAAANATERALEAARGAFGGLFGGGRR